MCRGGGLCGRSRALVLLGDNPLDIQACLGGASSSVPNKSHKIFGFPVHIKITLTLRSVKHAVALCLHKSALAK